ncbi:MAG: cupin domain-containing protein [Methanomassiliicoccales archaeon]|nr:cupin domain-containing protein [Methanomassiliicoccales archaeon]
MKSFPRSGYKEVSGDGYLKRIVLDGADLGVKGALLQEVQFNAGDKVAFHFHKATREIFYCLKGPAPFVINGLPTVMEEGDCIVCEPGDVHGNPVIERDFRILVLKVGYKEDDTVWLE